MYLVLLVYFIAGLTNISAVSGTFFLKESLSLTASQLVNLGLLASLPWSLKIVFGVLLDKTKYSYQTWIRIGAVVSGLSILLGSYFAFNVQALAPWSFGILAGINLLASVGAVLQDLAADTLAVSLYPEDKLRTNKLQVNSRTAIVAGGLLASSLTGLVAAKFTPGWAFLLPLPLELLVLLCTFGSQFRELKKNANSIEVSGKFLVSIGAYLVVLFLLQDNPPGLFILSAGYFAWLFRLLKIPAVPRSLVYAGLGMFFLRVIPGAGPGLTWFYVDKLGFDQLFMGQLSFYSNVAALIGTLVFGRVLLKVGVFPAAIGIITLITLLSLPDIGLFYGLHEVLGISARTIVLIDAELVSPLANFLMVILGVVVAKHVPEEGKAVYMSMTASLMNLALTGGDALTWMLTEHWVVTRTDFSQLGMLLTVGLVLSTVLSGLGLLLLKFGEGHTDDNKQVQP